MRSSLLALWIITIGPWPAKSQQLDAGVELSARLGQRVRVWRVDDSANVFVEGRVQLVQDTAVAILPPNEIHYVVVPIRLIERIAVPRSNAFALPLVTLGGTALGAWIAIARSHGGGPEPGLNFIGRLRLGTLGGLVGCVLANAIGGRLIPPERWVSIYVRRVQ